MGLFDGKIRELGDKLQTELIATADGMEERIKLGELLPVERYKTVAYTLRVFAAILRRVIGE